MSYETPETANIESKEQKIITETCIRVQDQSESALGVVFKITYMVAGSFEHMIGTVRSVESQGILAQNVSRTNINKTKLIR